jgi:hypothetical protein
VPVGANILLYAVDEASPFPRLRRGWGPGMRLLMTSGLSQAERRHAA